MRQTEKNTDRHAQTKFLKRQNRLLQQIWLPLIMDSSVTTNNERNRAGFQWCSRAH